jgi:hypothetical protein
MNLGSLENNSTLTIQFPFVIPALHCLHAHYTLSYTLHYTYTLNYTLYHTSCRVGAEALHPLCRHCFISSIPGLWTPLVQPAMGLPQGTDAPLRDPLQQRLVAVGKAAYGTPIGQRTPDVGFAIYVASILRSVCQGSLDEQPEVQEAQVVLQVCELYKPINVGVLGVFRVSRGFLDGQPEVQEAQVVLQVCELNKPRNNEFFWGSLGFPGAPWMSSLRCKRRKLCCRFVSYTNPFNPLFYQ